MSPEDKAIWDVAYNEEYDGLESLPTWAIATIKYDDRNRPKRAKYRLVVLGNLNYHPWSKESTAAPVLSQLELRLLTSLAVYHKRVLKNCDVKQAFIQSTLPSDEEYFLRPPAGCPRSKPGQYWRLLRSLYGLKRAPKLWFEMLSSHLQAMGLKSSPNSPCLFTGVLVPGEPPIFVGIYVDDIIYFSTSDSVEKQFEENLSTIGTVDFMGQVSLFLGTEFSWITHADGHITVSLTQQSFIETLIESLGIKSTHTSHFTTPFRSGHIIDSIPRDNISSTERDELRLRYQSLVGSLNWLAHTTRPDLSTVVSLLAQHQSDPSYGHYEAALHVTQYLANTKTFMSAYYIDLLGPLHWLSKRQKVTAASSAEAEIYATDECVKFLLELSQILEFLGVKDIFMPSTSIIFNDNNGCVQWSKAATSKGLRHIPMRENRIRENIVSKFVKILHIDGKINLADVFTKEIKDISHFVEIRDLFMCHRLLT